MEEIKLKRQRKLVDVMHELAIPFQMKGYGYLVSAIEIVQSQQSFLLVKQLYAQVASIHKTTTPRVERNIRHAIQRGYERANHQIYQQYFGSWIETCPTNAEFIYTLARYLKTEDL